MRSIDYRNEFIKIINDKVYNIETLVMEDEHYFNMKDNPVSNANYKSVALQSAFLTECKNMILLDSNLPPKELQYFLGIIEKFMQDFIRFNVDKDESVSYTHLTLPTIL